MQARHWVGFLAVLGLVRVCTHGGEADDGVVAVRVATFNIEHFPKDRRQIDGAFDEMARLDASAIALQEITDPDVLQRAARDRLGASWTFVHDGDPQTGKYPVHHLGVLFDRRVFALESTAVHDETRLDEGRFKPVFEVVLRPARGDRLRVLVVHLKSGSDGRGVRAEQLARMRPIVHAARATGDRVVVLGDFNATDDAGDRSDIAALAASTRMVWASEPLACTAFWDRDDGCPRSRLDHVLASSAPARIAAAGACATEGCEWRASCPVYNEHVSDHCPIVVDLFD